MRALVPQLQMKGAEVLLAICLRLLLGKGGKELQILRMKITKLRKMRLLPRKWCSRRNMAQQRI